MRALVLVLLVSLSLGCLADRVRRCSSPRLLTGKFSVAAQAGKGMVFVRYSYDAFRRAIRLTGFDSDGKESHHFDLLFLYRQHVMYKINSKNATCCKKPLKMAFHPLEIPKNAKMLAQVVLGSSSGPGQGVLVNTWMGEMQVKKGKAKYMSTVTEYGCIPVTNMFQTKKFGWIVTNFFNNVIGLADPQSLIPPSYCRGTKLEEENGEDTGFFSFF